MLADLRGKSVNAIILRKYNENQTQKKKKKLWKKTEKIVSIMCFIVILQITGNLFGMI